MRRICFILLLLGLSVRLSAAHTYVESSVLGSGNIVKLQITSTGIYMLTYDQILSYGLNPQEVRLLGYGGNLIAQDFTKARIDDVPSMPFYMYKGQDGVFNSGDYILFYANGPVGWEWYSAGGYYKHTRNCYADFGCYFLSDNAGEQRLLSVQGPIEEKENTIDVYTYTALQLHEQDQINLIDPNGESGGGREWYGESIYAGSRLSIPFSFANVVNGGQVVCRVDAAAKGYSSSTVLAKVAGKTGQCSFSSIGQHVMATTGSCLITTTNASGNSLPVTLQYSSSMNASQFFLNYIEMQVSCQLQMQDNLLLIRNTEHLATSTPLR